MNFSPRPHGYNQRRVGTRHLAYLAIVAVFIAGIALAWPTLSKDCVSLKARQYGSLEQYVPNEVVVKFDDGVDHAAALSAVASAGFEVLRTDVSEAGQVYFVKVPAGSQLQSVCALAADERVFYATLERLG